MGDFEGFEDRSVEKRLKRIERWLKRCMVACRCGSWSSALMEIECMEAEAREFRSDLWRVAAEEAGLVRRRSYGHNVIRSLKVIAVAAVMVMAVGLPLSLDQDRAFQGFSSESLALLTSTESDILDALRENLSNFNEGRVLLSLELPSEPDLNDEMRGAAAAVEPEPLSESPDNRGAPSGNVAAPRRVVVKVETKETEQAAEAPKTTSNPTVEEVISLIQVGQRALRTSEPAVRVIE